MATRQYNFSPFQGLKSHEKMNRACFNQKISSFPATINRRGWKNASNKQEKV